MKTITVQQLRAVGACPEGVAEFERQFGAEATVTLEAARRWMTVECSDDYLNWCAQHLLSARAQRAYDAAIAEAKRTFDAMRDEAQRAFDAIRDDEWRAFEAATAEARRAYDAAADEAQRAYDVARAEAFARARNQRR